MPNPDVAIAADCKIERLPRRKMKTGSARRIFVKVLEAAPILNDKHIGETKMTPGVQKTEFGMYAQFLEHLRHLPCDRNPSPHLAWPVYPHSNQEHDEVAFDPCSHALRDYAIHARRLIARVKKSQTISLRHRILKQFLPRVTSLLVEKMSQLPQQRKSRLKHADPDRLFDMNDLICNRRDCALAPLAALRTRDKIARSIERIMPACA